MLRIYGIDKIVGKWIGHSAYVKNINGVTRVTDMNGTHKELYQIQIINIIDDSVVMVYLDRNYVNKDIKCWYELSCARGSVTNKHFISKDTIGNIKELLEHIKIVAFD